jgi:hypothetical protein
MKYVVAVHTPFMERGLYQEYPICFETRRKARAFAVKKFCPRCTEIEIREYPDDYVWLDPSIGFVAGRVEIEVRNRRQHHAR